MKKGDTQVINHIFDEEERDCLAWSLINSTKCNYIFHASLPNFFKSGETTTQSGGLEGT